MRPSRGFLEPAWMNMGWLVAGEWELSFGGGPFAACPEAWVCGPTDQEAAARGTEGTVIGVRMLPWGWAHLTGQPARDFANRARPMTHAFGPEARALAASLRGISEEAVLELLDQFFLALSARRPSPPLLVARAYAVLASAEAKTVGDWSERLDISVRHLERLCLQHFGLSPKRLLKRERLMRTVGALAEGEERSWSLLIDDDYSDQSQFIREFRQFMRVPPGAWRSRSEAVTRDVVARTIPPTS